MTRQRSPWPVSSDDRRIRNRERGRRAHHLDELQAVDGRHFPIDEDDVGIDVFDGLKSGGAVVGFMDVLHADRHEHGAHDLAHVMIVIDDQDLDRRKARFEVLWDIDLHDAFAIKTPSQSNNQTKHCRIADG